MNVVMLDAISAARSYCSPSVTVSAKTVPPSSISFPTASSSERS
jgi:hypothetical protein